MRRALAIVALLLWAGTAQAAFTGYGAVYSWIPGTFSGKNFDGTSAGLTSADSYMTPSGLTLIGPGLEGQTLPSYGIGRTWIWQRYDGYRIYGPPFEAWPGGSRVFRADSSGVTVTGAATISATASADEVNARTKVTVNARPLSSFTSDIDGTVRYCSDCLKFTVPCTSGGSGTFAMRINGEWDCGNSGATDTTGLVVDDGRQNGQTILGSNRTTFNSLGFLLMRAYNDPTNAASIFLGSDVHIKGSLIDITGQGQTTGMSFTTGVNFVNASITGSLTIWGPGGNSNISGSPALGVQNGASSSTASPTIVAKAKTSQTGNIFEGRNSTNVVTFGVTPAGVISGSLASTGSNNDLQGSDIASTASITLGTGNVFRITGTADITSLSSRTDGTTIVLMFTGTAATNGIVDDNASLNLNGNMLYVPNETLTLCRVSGNWVEVSRSPN